MYVNIRVGNNEQFSKHEGSLLDIKQYTVLHKFRMLFFSERQRRPKRLHRRRVVISPISRSQPVILSFPAKCAHFDWLTRICPMNMHEHQLWSDHLDATMVS